MSLEISNWYNDPFVGKLLKDYEKQKDFGKFNTLGEHCCTIALDGRKQKVCRYYYRNSNTKKCLFLEKGYLCEARGGDLL